MAMTDEEKFLATINLEELKLKVDVWKTIIDVQKHFNKYRNESSKFRYPYIISIYWCNRC